MYFSYFISSLTSALNFFSVVTSAVPLSFCRFLLALFLTLFMSSDAISEDALNKYMHSTWISPAIVCLLNDQVKTKKDYYSFKLVAKVRNTLWFYVVKVRTMSAQAAGYH